MKISRIASIGIPAVFALAACTVTVNSDNNDGGGGSGGSTGGDGSGGAAEAAAGSDGSGGSAGAEADAATDDKMNDGMEEGAVSDAPPTCTYGSIATRCEICMANNCCNLLLACKANSGCNGALSAYFQCVAAADAGTDDCEQQFVIDAGNDGSGQANDLLTECTVNGSCNQAEDCKP